MNALKVNLFKNKTVAIIGSSGELEVNDYSKLINSVDIVVRVNVKTFNNNIFLPPKIKKNTTTRIDVLYHHGAQLGNQFKGDGNNKCVINKTSCISNENLAIFKKAGVKAVVLPNFNYKKCLKKKLGIQGLKIYPYPNLKLKNDIRISKGDAYPTTGISSIYDILQYSPSKLYIYGFDCYMAPDTKLWFSDYSKIGNINMTKTENNVMGSHNTMCELQRLYNICKIYKDKVIITEHLSKTFIYNNLEQTNNLEQSNNLEQTNNLEQSNNL